MFIGIVEVVGKLIVIIFKGSDVIISVDVGKLDMGDVKFGDSIVINGVCLMVVVFDQCSFSVDLLMEIFKKLGFVQYQVGDCVNFEKVMLFMICFGGYIVLGYVDGVGEIVECIFVGCVVDLWVNMLVEISKYVVEKGLIIVDGISLMVNDLCKNVFKLIIVFYISVEIIIDEF